MSVMSRFDSGLDNVPSREPRENAWIPVPRLVLVSLLLFFMFFLYELARDMEIPHLMDNVFVPIHEGGHLLFQYFGTTIGVAGGTFLQLFVPFALASYFAYHRQVPGVAFCMFFFFEQFLPVATYMADARAQQLPLVTVGDSEYVIHDWNYLFSRMGVLERDTQIAGAVRFVGWMGMIGVMIWLLWRGLNDVEEKQSSRED
jgi:hypothetical protein